MVRAVRCIYEHADGRACAAPPLRSGTRCYWHSPDKRDELAEGQRLGGLRRRKERTVAAAYDLGSVRTLRNIGRVLDVVVVDALSLENTPARGRLFNSVALTAMKLREMAGFDDEAD